jgi:ribosomal protein S18 acetylase RimI-like enzyme
LKTGYSPNMLTTRPATDSELPFLEDIFLRAMRVHITATRGSWDEAKERNQFHEQLQLEHTSVIEHGGVSVGFFMTFERGPYVELHTLCIAPEHQGRSIGTTVIRQITSDAQDQRREVRLSVLKSNTGARLLYERLGFMVTGETAHHYQMRLVS